MEIKKALTFRASSIGDCLMGKYLLENIHSAFPDARLGLVVASRAGMIRDLFEAYPWLEVIEANRYSPQALFALISNFYESDIIVTQYAGKKGGTFSLASKLFARMLAKRGGLIGFSDTSSWNTILYDKLVPIHSDIAVAEHDREALRAAGLSVNLPFPTLKVVQNDSVLSQFNVETKKFIIAHFFAGGAGRSISSEKSRELLLALRCAIPKNISILVSGAAADRELAFAIANGVEARVIAGETTLQEVMNLIKHSSAVVSVDTGMAHITAQLGTPLIVMRTCVGRNWWFSEQYGKDAPLTVFSRDELCSRGHIYKNYPDCINAIDMNDVASRMMGSGTMIV